MPAFKAYLINSAKIGRRVYQRGWSLTAIICRNFGIRWRLW